MTFDNFLSNVAYLYLIDESFQKISDVAGIDWNKLPNFDSTKIIRKYLQHRASLNHQLSLFEMREDVQFLEMTADVADIGRDEIELSHQFQKLYSQYNYTKLAEKILAEPEKAKHFLDTFSPDSTSPSESFYAADFMPVMIEQHRKDVEAGVARRPIEGFEQVSTMIGGFEPGRLIFLEGKTGFGKTQLALNLALRAARKHKCLYINMEMTLKAMAARLAVISSGMSFSDYNRGHYPPEKVFEPLCEYGWNLKMTPGKSMTLQSIISLMKKEKAEGLEFVFVDYDLKIDLPITKNNEEWRAMHKAAKDLEDISKELEICIIMLTQQNRAGENASSHRSTYASDTILEFRDDAYYGPIIEGKKTRFAHRNQAVRVEYNQSNCCVRELETVEILQRPKKQ